MITTEVASLIAKLSLDTSGFTSSAASIDARSVQKSVQTAIDDVDIDIKHSNLASTADDIRQENAEFGEMLNTIDIAHDASLAITETMRTWISTARDFETAWVGVTKTVTAPEGVDPDKFFGGLKAEIYQMSTEMPRTFQEIAAAMSAAAANGIDVNSLSEFTEAMLQFESATNGAIKANTAAEYFAKINNLTEGTEEDIDNLASSVVELGNHFGIQEKPVLDMSLAIASAGHNFGLTNDQIVGWSAAMSKTGLSAQSAGRAFRALTTQMKDAVAQGNADLTVFAETADMTTERFVECFEDDASEALLAFIENLSPENLSEVFEALNIGMDQEKLLLTNLSNSSEQVGTALDMSSKAFDENTALVNEANAANDTLDAQLQMFQNTITAIQATLGESLLPIIKDISDALLPLLQDVTKFISEHPGLAATITGVAIAFELVAAAAQIASVAMAMGSLGLAPWIGAVAILGAVVGVAVLLAEAFSQCHEMAAATVEDLEKMDPEIDDLTEINGTLYITPKFVNNIEGTDIYGEEFTEGTWVQYTETWSGPGWVQATEEEAAKLNERLAETAALAENTADAFAEDSVSGQIVETTETMETAASSTNDIMSQLDKQMSDFDATVAQYSGTVGEDFTQSMTDLTEPMKELQSLMESEDYKSLTTQTIDQTVCDSWDTFGTAVDTVSNGFEAINATMSSEEFLIKAVPEDTIKSYQDLAKALGEINTALSGGEMTEDVTMGEEIGTDTGVTTMFDSIQPISEDTTASYQNLAAAFNEINTAINGGELSGEGTVVEETAGIASALDSLPGKFSGISENATLLAEYLSGSFVEGVVTATKALADIEADSDGSVSFNGGNTLYTALGAIYGLTEDIYATTQELVNYWKGDFVNTVEIVKIGAGKIASAFDGIANSARDAAAACYALRDALLAVLAAQQDLDGYMGGGGNDGGDEGGTDGEKASGGPVIGGNTYLVGEEGPELFTPNRSGYIIPNDELFGGGSREEPTIVINFNGDVIGDERSISAYVTKAARSVIRQEVFDAA